MKKNILSIGILLVSLFMFINIDEVKAERVKHCSYNRLELQKTVISNIISKKLFEYTEVTIDVEPVKNGIFVTRKFQKMKYNFKKKNSEITNEKISTALITYENSKNKRVYSGSDMFAQGIFAEDFYVNKNVSNLSDFTCGDLYTDDLRVEISNTFESAFTKSMCPICNLLVPVKETKNNRNLYSKTYADTMSNVEGALKLAKLKGPTISMAEQSDLAKNAITQSTEKEKSSGCNIFGKEGSKTRNIIKWFVNLIRYAIPILVIILSVADYVGVVFSGEEDKMKNAHKKLALRIVAAIVFVLIPFLLKFLVDITELALDTGINSSDMFCGFL